MKNLTDTKKLFFVLLPLVLVIAFFEISLRETPDSYQQKKEIFEHHKNEAEVLITGNSQALYGIDPDSLSFYALNMAFVNQDIWYDVQMIRYAMSEMPKLKMVLLQLNYLSFGYRLDKITESWRCSFYSSRWNFKRPYNDILLRDYSFLALYTPRIALSWLKNNFNSSAAYHLTARGFENVPPFASVLVNDSSARFWAHRHQTFMDSAHFQRNFELLKALSRDLRINNIRFLIFSTPLCLQYRKSCSKSILAGNTRFLAHLRKEEGVEYFDFRSDLSFQQQDFLDDYHLNSNGAAKLSHKIDSCCMRLGF